MSALLDSMVGDDYTSTPTAGQSAVDAYEAAKMEPYNPAASQGLTWWEASLQYGLSRAIDNRLGPPMNTAGNTAAGTYAGANGRTYGQNGSAQVVPGSVMGIPPLFLLAGAALVAVLVLKG